MESLIESLVEDSDYDIDDLEDLYEFCQEFIEEMDELEEINARAALSKFKVGASKGLSSARKRLKKARQLGSRRSVTYMPKKGVSVTNNFKSGKSNQ